MDYQTYRYRKEAKDAASVLQDAHPILVHWPQNPNANEKGNTYVIRVDDVKYLRTDGEVR